MTPSLPTRKCEPPACDGCAFKPGAQANTEPYNSLKALICALGFVPFFCHHTRDGRDITSRPKTMTKTEMRAQQLVVCGGWAAKIARLRARGHYAGRIKTLQFVANYAVEQLDAMLDYETNDEEGRVEARRNLWVALEMLRAKRDPEDDPVFTTEIEAHLRQATTTAAARGRWTNETLTSEVNDEQR